MDKESIISLINQKKWYHKYELMPGIISPGKLAVKPGKTLDAQGISGNLTGKKVLDIGAWDGPYTFEFERRGAIVTALDIQDPDCTGFNVAKKIIGSKAAYICSSVYDISPELANTFDIVFFQGVYYHLKYPLLAFRKTWEVLKQDGEIHFGGAILDFANNVDTFWKDKEKVLSKISSLPVTYFALDKYGRFDDPSCWFIPTKRCLHDWLASSGFIQIEIHGNERNSTAYGKALKDANFIDFEHGKM